MGYGYDHAGTCFIKIMFGNSKDASPEISDM